MTERLTGEGLLNRTIPFQYFSSIDHDDMTRTAYYEVKDVSKSKSIARAYRKAKAGLMSHGAIVDETARLALMTHIQDSFTTLGRIPTLRLTLDGRDFCIRFRREILGLFGRMRATVKEINSPRVS